MATARPARPRPAAANGSFWRGFSGGRAKAFFEYPVMIVMRVLAAALVFATGATAAISAAPAKGSGATCVFVRILPDGRELRSTVADPNRTGVRIGRGNGVSAASAVSRGASSSSVSVSSSSSSARGGRSMARAVSSHTDERGRTVTTTRDERGCTILVDERDLSGEE